MLLKKTVSLLLFLFLFSYSSVFSETLNLVTLESKPAEYTENGVIKGINVDIVREALKRMGYDCKIIFLPWKRALNSVKTGQADGIIDAAYSEERAVYMYYPSEAIFIEEWYCFKRKDTVLTLDKDLANAAEIRLGISYGFVYGGIIQEAIDGKRFKEIQKVHNNELNLKKLIAGRFDMFVGGKKNTLFFADKMGCSDKIETVKMTGTDQEYLLSSSKTYLGFSKKTMDNEIAFEFSGVIAEMKKDGTIDGIMMKYRYK